MSLNFISHWGEQRENWKLLSLVRSPAMFSTKSTYRNYVNPHWTCWLEHWLNKDPMDQRFSHNPYSWSAWYTPEKLTTGTWKSPICKGKVIWTKPSWPIVQGFFLMSRDFCWLQTSIFLGFKMFVFERKFAKSLMISCIQNKATIKNDAPLLHLCFLGMKFHHFWLVI